MVKKNYISESEVGHKILSIFKMSSFDFSLAFQMIMFSCGEQNSQLPHKQIVNKYGNRSQKKEAKNRWTNGRRLLF